jgi:hypothetical protein
MKRYWLASVVYIMLAEGLQAQAVTDMKVDAPAFHADRKEMLDVLRSRLKTKFKFDAMFEVHYFKSAIDWAWLTASVSAKAGEAISLPDNSYDCCHVEALFQKVKGQWYIADWGAFSTDVWWEGIAYRHPKAPKILFDEVGLHKNE